MILSVQNLYLYVSYTVLYVVCHIFHRCSEFFTHTYCGVCKNSSSLVKNVTNVVVMSVAILPHKSDQSCPYSHGFF